jgi:cation transport regulator ChaC
VKDVLLWLFGGIGITITGWIFVRLRRIIPRLLLRRRVRVNTFTAAGSPYMDDFYDFFTAKIATAQANMYITGEGFDCIEPDGRRRAERMIDATRAALQGGARVVRLQTRITIDLQWLNYLKELLADYPSAFELYAVNNPSVFQTTTSVCTIDVDHPDNNCTEFMLQLERHFGTDLRHVAGTGVFITGHQELAQAIRDRILASVKDSQVATRIRTPEHADTFFSGEYYFAYGSNMCQSQMVSRCPSAIRIATGVLLDSRLVFNRRGSYRPGGVASIQPACDERVYGVVWKISTDEFQRLDETEDKDAYRREEMTVHSLNGETYRCQVYRAIPKGTVSPDPEYLEELVQCAKESALPSHYISSLERLISQPTKKVSTGGQEG